MLNFSKTLFLCFAVLFCLSQIPDSQADLTFNWIAKMREDCIKKYHSKKDDVQDELQDIMHDIIKKALKYIQKTMKTNGNVKCIETVRDSHTEELNSHASTSFACLDKIGETIDPQFSSLNLSVLDAMQTRSLIKLRLDQCSDSGKKMMKSVKKSFELNGKRCLK